MAACKEIKKQLLETETGMTDVFDKRYTYSKAKHARLLKEYEVCLWKTGFLNSQACIENKVCQERANDYVNSIMGPGHDYSGPPRGSYSPQDYIRNR